MKSVAGYFRSLRRKIVKERIPAEDIAGGWALGVFIGFAVPFGFQLAVSIPLAMMMRVSKIGATVGTLVTNPLTIFFIYPAQTWFVYNLVFGHREMGELPVEWTMKSVMALSGPVVISFFLGGLALALFFSPIAYFTVKRVVLDHRARVERKSARLP